jgi:hypothetical protein
MAPIVEPIGLKRNWQPAPLSSNATLTGRFWRKAAVRGKAVSAKCLWVTAFEWFVRRSYEKRFGTCPRCPPAQWVATAFIAPESRSRLMQVSILEARTGVSKTPQMDPRETKLLRV